MRTYIGRSSTRRARNIIRHCISGALLHSQNGKNPRKQNNAWVASTKIMDLNWQTKEKACGEGANQSRESVNGAAPRGIAVELAGTIN